MRDERQVFSYISPATPEAIPDESLGGNLRLVPRGLFSRIIKRLGLERQLGAARKHLGFFVPALLVFVFLSVFAFIGLKHVLAQSSFGPFLSLILSDPGIVLKYWQSFLFSIFESMPGAHILFFLVPLALFLLFVRLAGVYFEKLLTIIKLISKSRFVRAKRG